MNMKVILAEIEYCRNLDCSEDMKWNILTDKIEFLYAISLKYVFDGEVYTRIENE